MEDNEPVSKGTGWWPPDFLDKMESVSLSVWDEVLTAKESVSHNSSQVLWSTGSFSRVIPNGFYSLIPDKKLKELFPTVPSLDELQSLGMDGLKADIILVDTEKDKKLCMLKQLSAAFKGLSSNPVLVIKKIASLVFDFYKRPNPEPSQPKAASEDASQFIECKGVQLLGQIRHGSCRPRAILFKFLADAVGLGSKIVVGLPKEGAVEFSDSYKHMSVVVMLNSVELLVDLMRFPGQLIPFSAKSIFASHISVAGESDSAENDSCDSPLEPNSPMCGISEKVEADVSEQDENLHQRRTEASSNLSGRSLRNSMLRSRTFSEGKLSSSHSEPNIANGLWRHNQRTDLAEDVAASSSPERHLLRAKGRSTLGSDCGVGTPSPRSDGSSGPVKPSIRRIRRRSISITPEIGDDIVR